MGLPVYSRSSSRPDLQNASKADPTARARSAIRREPTVRSRRPARFAPRPYLDTLQYGDELAVRATTWDDISQTRPRLDRTQAPRGDSFEAYGMTESDMAALNLPENEHHSHIFGSPQSLPQHRNLRERSPRPRSRRGPAADLLPPLRRMGRRDISDVPRLRRHRRPIHLPPAPEVNGLGDRQRSWSPLSGDDQWETLLNTITPDPSLPSASSSFASGAATAPANGADVIANPSNNQQLSQLSAVNNADSRSRSISPMPPPYMATPETDNDRNEQEDNDNCDVPPTLTLASPSTTSDSASASNNDSPASGSDFYERELYAARAARAEHRRARSSTDSNQQARLEQAHIISEFTDVCTAFTEAVRNMGNEPVDQRTVEMVENVVARIQTIEPAMSAVLRDYRRNDGEHWSHSWL